MKHRSATLAIAATAALVLAACGDDEANVGDVVGEGSGDDCTIADPVSIGAALSLTGGAASYGQSQQNGLRLAADHLEEKGGVSYELSVEDDQTDPRQGITVFEGFTDGGVSAIIGPTLSNAAFQAQPIAQDAGVPVVAISNTAEGVTAQGDYIFRVSLTEQQVIPQTVEAAIDSFELENVVVMYSNDDAFTQSGFEVFDETLEASDVEVSETLTFSVNDTDFRPLLTQAQNSDPDAIVVSGLIEAAVPLVTQARELGIEVPIIGGNGFNNPLLIDQGGEAAEGVVVGAAWNSASDNPENTAFLEAYSEEFGSNPDQFAAQAYAGLMVIDEAVRAGCSAERDAIQEELNNISDFPTVLGNITINDERDTEHEAVVQIIEDDSFAVLD